MTKKTKHKTARTARLRRLGRTHGRAVIPGTGSFTAAELAPLLNAYSAAPGATKVITVPHASTFDVLREVTVSGQLLPKQVVTLDLNSGKRTASQLGDGSYKPSADGDIHLCLGTKPGQVHIACEVQNAKPWAATFNQSIGQQIVITGFFRSLFEHPGFRSNDDAHIFEVHPVRAVTIEGQIIPFDVDIPDQASIHTWTSPHNLNVQDNKIQVVANVAEDTLTFSHMDGQDENYVSASGTTTNVQIPDVQSGPATFTFTSTDIGHPLEGIALQATRAIKQLGQIGAGATVNMIALRNIDLARAAQGEYVISLLAIDLQLGLR
jgi:hypothetical protein